AADRDLPPAVAPQVASDQPEVALAVRPGHIQGGGLVLQDLLTREAFLISPVERFEKHVDEELSVLRAGCPDAHRPLADLLSHSCPFQCESCAITRGGSARSYRRTRLRSEEHTSELQSRFDLVCRLLLEKKNARVAL